MEDLEPISTVTLRTVRPGKEVEFEQSLKEFFERSRSVPGQLAIHVVKPVPGSREYGILRTFSSKKAKEDFFASEIFLDWQIQAAPFMEDGRKFDSFSGLEAWFTLPGANAMIPPPKWKMAAVSTLGGTVAAILVSLGLGPHLTGMSPMAQTGLISLGISLVMTYALMPALSRLLKKWLY